MVHGCSVRQVDEKHLPAEVNHMTWSPRMDLIAVSNVQSEVMLYRLSWQKVWTLPPPSDDVNVSALSWRPDGKLVAIGYSSGHLVLCDIENANVLHSIDVIGGISHMTWVAQAFSDSDPWTFEPYAEDTSDMFIPKLLPHTKTYDAAKKTSSEESVEDSKKLSCQKEVNVLLVGTHSDSIHLYVYGVFPVVCLSLNSSQKSTTNKVISGVLSRDLRQLCVVVACCSDDDIQYRYLVYDASVLHAKHKEIRMLALKYGHLYSLTNYLNDTVKLMCEAWEDILVEMDKKLLKFAEEKRNFGVGTVSNDFLELLMFGTASSQLESFLLHDLTEKGLKKLGHSIETSYSNIQKLVVKQLRNVSHAILYHVSELRGLARWKDKFSDLGLGVDLVDRAVQAAGSFVLKTTELQQVIDGSITNFKAFFRWLYVAILRLSEQVPHADISKMTQYDINFVADFLKDNFSQFSEEDGTESPQPSQSHSKHGFKLEKVGQYLKDEDLHYPANVSGNPWVQFLADSTYTKDSSLLYPPHPQKSLIQLQQQLESALRAALTQPADAVSQLLECVANFSLGGLHPAPTDGSVGVRLSQCHVEAYIYSLYLVPPRDSLYLIRHPVNNYMEVKVARIVVSRLDTESCDPELRVTGDSFSFVDASFYDENHLSLLVEAADEHRTPSLVQVSISALVRLAFTPLHAINAQSPAVAQDISDCIEPTGHLALDNMRAVSFAVSGTRKVACVLFSSRRRVRLFLMDADDDDEDETLDTTSVDQSVVSPRVMDIEGEDKENIRLET